MRYGLPYKGSKNSIAEWIVDNLPKAEIFVDLFFGGGAITHRAMLTKKYKRFIINDIDARLPKLFVDCAHGKYTTETHPEWISREEFNVKKSEDAYIALIWSFGNNGKDYLYGTDIEEYKHAYHVLIFDNDSKPLEKYGVKVKLSKRSNPYKRYLEYNQQIKSFFGNIKQHKHELENFERLQTLERLESLYRLQSLQSLQSYGTDYQNVPIPDGSLIYCDIPYSNTNCGKYGGFDHDRFYTWAEKQDNIFISEYNMPDDFIEVANVSKSVLSASNGNSGKVEEKIYTNQRTYNRMSADFKYRRFIHIIPYTCYIISKKVFVFCFN